MGSNSSILNSWKGTGLDYTSLSGLLGVGLGQRLRSVASSADGRIFTLPPGQPRQNSLSSMKWRGGQGRGGAFGRDIPQNWTTLSRSFVGGGIGRAHV